MKLFLQNYLLLILLSLLTLFSCVEKSTTDSNNPPTTPPAPSLAIDYDISGNFYIALTNKPLELTQKTDFGSQSNFSVSPSLPNGLSINITNGNISGTPTNSSLPTSYTVTATKDSTGYTKTISLGVVPSQVWVTNVNPANPYQLTAFVEGDRSKQITDWTWGSSDDTLATVNNGMVRLLSTASPGTAIISASKDSFSNGMAFTISEVTNVNGGKIIKERGNIHLIINSGTTALTNYQFSSLGLTSVEIPNSVTSIANNLFKGNQLTSVVIPNSVTYIEWEAFYQNQLTSVIIPNSVTNIGESAFAGNQLTSVVIPNSVTHINSYTFDQNQLTSVVIPDSVTNISTYAFTSNPNLGEVSLKESLYNNIVTTDGTNYVFGTQVTNYIKR